MKDYYEILGLKKDARPEEIREKYRQLVTSCHPDKFPDPGQKAHAEDIVKEVNEAYEVLRDPAQRAKYDRLKGGEPRETLQSVHPPVWTSPHPSRTPPVVPVDKLDSIYTKSSSIDHLHYPFYAALGDMIEVRLDRAAKLLLLDDFNYSRFLSGNSFYHLGGYVLVSPLVLSLTRTGNWHLVVDLSRCPGPLRIATRLIRRGWW